ncbi:hypothetical protein R5R35_003595 [Gryllus longicercus]|uniref:O-acyltransferase n=1 Tax=Gryllus longicercus TaxID=2509291 RepID=A0AAN9VAF7_9ORTH
MENMNGESRTSRHDNGALPSKHGRLEGNGSSDVTMKKIAKLQELQENMIRQMDEQFKEIVGHMVEGIDNVDHVNHFHYDNAKYSNRAKSSKDGKLSDKIFLARESLLTDLFQIKHFYTIYNIFIAILIILFLNTAVYDIVSTGTLNLGLSLIQWNFGKFHIFFLMWILMMIGTVGVYCSMHFWAHYRKEYYGKSASRKAWDYGWLGLYIIYQVIFGIWPVAQVLKYNLPPASSMALLMEQVRLIMKSHAFVRSNIPRALTYKPHSEQDEKKLIPEFGHFLYFLFVPTLVYRDSYPRTHKISWHKVIWHFLEVVGVIFYDWWNANSYAEYYRMWNLVVHDWLYTYIFKDYCLLIKSKSRLGPTLTVFIVSAIVHEYILMFVFRFFYPLLFVAFGGFSAALVFLTGSSSKRGNLFMWLTLCLGTGVLTAAYSMEWYARINCPQVLDTVTDFFVPRSWFCNAVKQ